MKTTRCGVDCIIKMLSLCLVAICAAPAAAQQLQLSGPDSVSKEGYFSVSITSENEQKALQNLRVQVAASKNFSSIEKEFPALGDFRQLSLTGFSNGNYYLRAVADNVSQPSNVIQVQVNHYPLWQALSLFAVGLALFLLLLIVLWRGQRQASATEEL